MKLVYTPRFKRAYKKLSAAQKTQTEEALRLFEKDPLTPALRNHALHGQAEGHSCHQGGL